MRSGKDGSADANANLPRRRRSVAIQEPDARAIAALTDAVELLDRLAPARLKPPRAILELAKLRAAVTRSPESLDVLCLRIAYYKIVLTRKRSGRPKRITTAAVLQILATTSVYGLPVFQPQRGRGRPTNTEDADARMLALLDEGRVIIEAKGTRYTRKGALSEAIYARARSDLPTPLGALEKRDVKLAADELAARYAARVPDANKRKRKRLRGKNTRG